MTVDAETVDSASLLGESLADDQRSTVLGRADAGSDEIASGQALRLDRRCWFCRIGCGRRRGTDQRGDAERQNRSKHCEPPV